MTETKTPVWSEEAITIIDSLLGDLTATERKLYSDNEVYNMLLDIRNAQSMN